jgi:hypothetical protein
MGLEAMAPYFISQGTIMNGYNTGKVIIGLTYKKDVRPAIVGDAITLQTALLNYKDSPPALWQRLVNKVWRWL